MIPCQCPLIRRSRGYPRGSRATDIAPGGIARHCLKVSLLNKNGEFVHSSVKLWTQMNIMAVFVQQSQLLSGERVNKRPGLHLTCSSSAFAPRHSFQIPWNCEQGCLFAATPLPFKFHRDAVGIVLVGDSVGVREFVPLGFVEHFLACNLHAPGPYRKEDARDIGGPDGALADETV